MTPEHADIVVVGAGPAGLAAAASLAGRGMHRILVVDRDDEAGGLPRFCHHPGFGWEYTHRLESGPGLVRRLLRALDPGIITIAIRTSALAVRPGPEIDIVGIECGHVRVRPRVVVLATGIRERPRSARLVPGRRPAEGILTTGQLQQMVARGVPVKGRRAVVVGTEHVAFSILLTARHAGLEIMAMVGAEDRVMSYAGAGLAARFLMGVPIHLSSKIEDIHGSERVESVTLCGPAGTRTIPCDTVIFSGDFIPDAALLPGSGIDIARVTAGPSVDQFGRTSAVGVFAAGNLLRAVETSGLAAIEGARVGTNVAAYLEGMLGWPRDAASIRVGDGLSYVVPQYWAPSAGLGGAVQALPVSLRALADIRRARLSLSEDGQAIWTGHPTKTLRHRRLALPAAALDRLRGGDIALRIDPA
ncbi:MAG: FAD-dependent oxidoreductase [Alphaproteobacteria bacterium]|nr:FAD-dependent oxidoreductase [Alphaproteobacteria bacterium]